MSEFEYTPTPPPGAFSLPEGRKLPGPTMQHGVLGEVRSQAKATDDTIRYAMRYWPERDYDDFVIDGRTWTDADGTEYRLCHGNPLAGVGTDGDASAADAFVVSDGQLLFLRRVGRTDGTSVAVGSIGGRRQ